MNGVGGYFELGLGCSSLLAVAGSQGRTAGALLATGFCVCEVEC